MLLWLWRAAPPEHQPRCARRRRQEAGRRDRHRQPAGCRAAPQVLIAAPAFTLRGFPCSPPLHLLTGMAAHLLLEKNHPPSVYRCLPSPPCTGAFAGQLSSGLHSFCTSLLLLLIPESPSPSHLASASTPRQTDLAHKTWVSTGGRWHLAGCRTIVPVLCSAGAGLLSQIMSLCEQHLASQQLVELF